MNNIFTIAQKHKVLVPCVPVIGTEIFDRSFLNSHIEEINLAHSLLADDFSRKIFEGYVNFQFGGRIELLKEFETPENEIYKNILKFNQNEIFIDIGAYRGDTVENFVKQTKGCYEKIIAAEPDFKTYQKLIINCENLKNFTGVNAAITGFDGEIGCIGMSGLSSSGFSVRPVIASSGEFDANGHEYVDLGLEMSDGKKLYFATMNVGETSPAGCLTKTYRWGATEDNGEEWKPESDSTESPEIRLDAAHDIATITWGEKWHVPSPEEWNLLIEKCDYERKEANESGYGVAGFFFYNKSDHSQSIFLPVSTWSGELAYWSSELCGNSYSAYVFCSYGEYIDCNGMAGLDSS
jgi:hypothetical protein